MKKYNFKKRYIVYCLTITGFISGAIYLFISYIIGDRGAISINTNDLLGNNWYFKLYIYLLIIELIFIAIYAWIRFVNLRGMIKKYINYTKKKIVKIYYEFLEKVVIVCQEQRSKYVQDKSENIKLTDLAPIDDSKLTSNYIKYITDALKNNKINNLALTGIYGAGKSSILRQFEKNNKKYKVLNISLANFDSIDGGNEADKELQLEKAIVKQMFYKVKAIDVPQSRFNRINRINRFKAISYAFGIVFLVTLINLDWVDKKITIVNNFIDKHIKFEKFAEASHIFLLALATVFGLYFCYRIMVFILYKFKINKVKILNNELESIESTKGSSFNTYIDEIIYFFQIKKYDVVIFEDLDRFDNIKIFTKLRELNNILVESEQINNKIVFIYALKDDLFVEKIEKDNRETEKVENIASKNRTKFFELVIPVIPVINSSNSYEEFKRILTKNGLIEKVSDEFLSRVSLYIDDMRLINNIVNEFGVYKENLNINIKLNNENIVENNSELVIPEKLLAIIIYKNLYPMDFAKLQINEGLIYGAFSNKKDLINNSINAIDEKINNINYKLKELDTSYIKSKEELMDYYILKFIQVFGENRKYVQLDESIENLEYISIEDFDKILKQSSVTISNINGYNAKDIKSSRIATVENTLVDYRIRSKEYEPTVQIKKESYKKELQMLEEEKQVLKNSRLVTLLNSSNIKSDIGVYKEINNNKLLKFLISTGKIDENYHDYITYFYPGSLKDKDKVYLKSVVENEPLDMDYEIIGINKILEKLSREDFGKESILNYSLIKSLIEIKDTDSKYVDLYNTLIIQLSNDTLKSKEFISKFLTYNNANENDMVIRANLIKSLCNSWTRFGSFIHTESNWTEENIKYILRVILNEVENEDILKQNDVFKYYLSNREDFINLVDEASNDKLELLILNMNIKFKKIGLYENNELLFDIVYRNSWYEMNEFNISNILNKYHNTTMISYTAIVESNCEPLKLYIKENIECFIKEVLINSQHSLVEKERYIVELLNRNEDQLSKNTKIDIIRKLEFKIINISDLNNKNLWSVLFENNKVAVTWFNINDYYKQRKTIEKYNSSWKTVLINCFNNVKVVNDLSLGFIQQIDEDDLLELCIFIIEEQDISIECLKSLICLFSNKFTIEGIESENIINERIPILINSNLIYMDEVNLSSLQNNHPEYLQMFIKSKIEEFMNIMDKCNLNSEEYLKLIKDPQILDIHKVDIINNFNVDILSNSLNAIDILQVIEQIKEIQEISEDTVTELLRNSTNLFVNIKIINTYYFENGVNLTIDEVSELLISSLTNENINQLNDNYILNNIIIDSIITSVLDNGVILEIKDYVVRYLIKKTNSIELQIGIIMELIDQVNREVIYGLLECMDNPYCEIKIGKNRPKLDNNELNMELVEVLKENKIISNFTQKDEYINISLLQS